MTTDAYRGAGRAPQGRPSRRSRRTRSPRSSCGSRSTFVVALPADLERRAAAHRRHLRGADRAHRRRPRGRAAAQGRVRGGARRPTRRRSPTRATTRQAIAGETRDKLNAQAEERRKALEGELNVQARRRREDRSPTPRRPPWRTCAASRSTLPRAIVERLIGTAPAGAAVDSGGRRRAEALKACSMLASTARSRNSGSPSAS